MKRTIAAAVIFLAYIAISPSTALAANEPAGATGIALDARVELAWTPVTGATSYNAYWATTPLTATEIQTDMTTQS